MMYAFLKTTVGIYIIWSVPIRHIRFCDDDEDNNDDDKDDEDDM